MILDLFFWTMEFAMSISVGPVEDGEQHHGWNSC
jgi:hypothetical protein